MSDKEIKKIGGKMDKQKVTKWVKKYQKANPNETHGWLFGCDILCELLEAEGSHGIWFFKGINDEGKERLVLFPADEKGNMLGKIKSLGAMAKDDGDDDLAADEGRDCPPFCPPF